jgi:cytochrome c peroxidase
MVKRGNDFNPDGGDWEWFMLNADGSIASEPAVRNAKMRGANLMNGMCVSCHSAGSTDYTFTK